MGLFSKFEDTVEDSIDKAADKFFDAPISPVQISKKAEKQMRRNKAVGAGKTYAPTLYTVLVNPSDDKRLFGYYPTLAGEIETYLHAKATQSGLVMDGQPLVRFFTDDGLRSGKFEVVAELVAAPIIAELRQEEMERYGLANKNAGFQQVPVQQYQQPVQQPAQQPVYPNQDYGAYEAQQEAAFDEQDPYAPKAHYVPEPDFEQSISFDDAGAAGAAGIAASAAGAAALGQQAVHGAAAPVVAGAAVAAGAFAFERERAQEVAPDVAPETMLIPEAVEPAEPTAYLTDWSNGNVYTLAANRIVLGRETTCDIIVSDIAASRTHADIRMNAQGGWTINDLNSTNGTKLNGRPVRTAPLHDGDRITVGTTDLVFSIA